MSAVEELIASLETLKNNVEQAWTQAGNADAAASNTIGAFQGAGSHDDIADVEEIRELIIQAKAQINSAAEITAEALQKSVKVKDDGAGLLG